MHGGLNGTEDTGYDDDAMTFYLSSVFGGNDSGMVQLDELQEE